MWIEGSTQITEWRTEKQAKWIPREDVIAYKEGGVVKGEEWTIIVGIKRVNNKSKWHYWPPMRIKQTARGIDAKIAPNPSAADRINDETSPK